MPTVRWFLRVGIILVVFTSIGFAEMTAMSLQELQKESDAVVVGEILEPQNVEIKNTDGVEVWGTTCHVERYIYAKIHNPNVEEGKRSSIIHIISSQIPNQVPVPIKLIKGKKYLLFLKEAAPRDNRDIKDVYELASPYHGAFEAGQDYLVWDEKNSTYPAAIKMSFEEIINRISPKVGKPKGTVL